MRIVLYLIAILLLLCFPLDTAQAARNALHVWAVSVVPVLFPYMLFCRLLLKDIGAVSLPRHVIAAVLGMLGGSPNGAAVIASVSGDIPLRKRFALCALTGTISPMFILGAIQSWTNDATLCHALLVCHWAGAFACAVIVYAIYRGKPAASHTPSAYAHEGTASPLSQSIDAILQVGGCIILYSVLSAIIKKALAPFSSFHPLIHAALEISGGIHAICESGIPAKQKSILLAGACGFSGLSILSQNHTFLSRIGVRFGQLFAFALLRMLVSAGMMALLQSASIV